MNKKIFLLFLFLFSTNSYSQTSAPERDTQFWHDTTVSFSPCKTANCDIKFLKSFSGFVSGTFRIGRNVSHLVDERVSGGIEMKFTHHL